MQLCKCEGETKTRLAAPILTRFGRNFVDRELDMRQTRGRSYGTKRFEIQPQELLFSGCGNCGQWERMHKSCCNSVSSRPFSMKIDSEARRHVVCTSSKLERDRTVGSAATSDSVVLERCTES